MKNCIAFRITGLFLLLSVRIFALEPELAGQLSGWTTASSVQDKWRNQSGARYLPQLTVSQAIGAGAFLDLNVGLNSFVTYTSDWGETEEAIAAEAKLYRLTARFATNQTETRLGLQKINFGPARLLRPLRWFDQLDQRDPLGMTDGVYALLFRYTALNNANVRLWGLYGNDAPKGIERLPSANDAVEFGGRLQYPVLGGELAATTHTRAVNGQQLKADDFTETRFALDGRWEYGVGIWFESVAQQQDSPKLPYAWTTMTTVGLDYTIGIGNGVYLVFEHTLTGASDRPFGWDEDAQMSACMLNYPVGLFDSVSAIGFYNWERQEYSQHLGWQRAYDTITISANLFRYPDTDESAHAAGQSGYGGQLMALYYH